MTIVGAAMVSTRRLVVTRNVFMLAVALVLSSCASTANKEKEESKLSDPYQQQSVVPLRVAAGSQSQTDDASPSKVMNANHKGSAFDLSDKLEGGKTTLFYFHSDACPYCEAMDPLIEKLAKRKDNLAVYRVFIDRPDADGIDFDSPAAAQFGIHRVPSFIIYDEKREVAAKGDDAKETVRTWMREGGIAQ